MDNLTIEQRRFAMSQVKNKNTKLELRFRRYIWLKGLRGYRIKQKMLGNPDLYYPKKKVAVFIDGCFWHGCKICNEHPVANSDYWKAKFERNIVRDKKINSELAKQGIKVFRIWEHEIKTNPEEAFKRIRSLLN